MALQACDLDLLLRLVNPSYPDRQLIEAYVNNRLPQVHRKMPPLDNLIKLLDWPEFTHAAKRRLIQAHLLAENGVELTSAGRIQGEKLYARYMLLRKGIALSERTKTYEKEVFKDSPGHWFACDLDGRTFCGNNHIFLRTKPNERIRELIRAQGSIPYSKSLLTRMIATHLEERDDYKRVFPSLFQACYPTSEKVIWFYDREPTPSLTIPMRACFHDFLKAVSKGRALSFFAYNESSNFKVLIEKHVFAFVMPLLIRNDDWPIPDRRLS